ncbi:MAG: phytanoyl-CoA dioxygenase family protein [Planctomycetes bacterium]|nr:phytanoyl-CoA dioxygenase family protein [Planctomycetota bacterium]
MDIANRFTTATWNDFERDGYLRLGRTLDRDGLSALQDRIDAYMEQRLSGDRLMMQLDLGGDYAAMAEMTTGSKGATLEYRKIERLETDPLFLTYLQEPIFRDACVRTYGDIDIAIMRAMFMNKPARKGTLLPWHQDGGTGWGLDRHPLLTVWTALDPATIANGCVQIIPGSHRLGLLSERGHTITQEMEALHCRPERIVHLELDAGESVLLHNWVLHRSDVNRTDRPRRAFSCCYMDGRTRQRTSGTTYPIVFRGSSRAPAAAGVPVQDNQRCEPSTTP